MYGYSLGGCGATGSIADQARSGPSLRSLKDKMTSPNLLLLKLLQVVRIPQDVLNASFSTTETESAFEWGLGGIRL